jgi:phosphoserine phosphatase
MARIVVVRHGHVEGIQPECFRGRMDLELTDLGYRQAHATAARIAQHWRPVMVYTSPMGRCVATGQVIANAIGTPFAVLDDLNDIDYGEWQGKSHQEMCQHSPALYRRWLASPDLVRFPSGESLQQLSARVVDALRLIVEKHPEATTVIAGHDSGNRALLLQALGLPLSAYWRIVQDPCGLSEIVTNDGLMSVQRMNDTAHLERQDNVVTD